MHRQRSCWLITHWGAQALGSSREWRQNPSSLNMEAGRLLAVTVIVVPLWFLLFPSAELLLLIIWIYLHWRIPWSVFQESHQLGTPMEGGGPRGEAPADNLDIAQASFEPPWQIHPSLNPTPHSHSLRGAISICSTLKYILECLAASSLICQRSCLRWSSPFPLPSTSSVTHWSRNLVIYRPTLFLRLML